MKKKVAIQGIKGSFHHQVALEYFQENVTIDECLSFEALADSLLNNLSQLAVMAIENSIAGSIIPNYALIDNNNFHIICNVSLNSKNLNTPVSLSKNVN